MDCRHPGRNRRWRCRVIRRDPGRVLRGSCATPQRLPRRRSGQPDRHQPAGWPAGVLRAWRRRHQPARAARPPRSGDSAVAGHAAGPRGAVLEPDHRVFSGGLCAPVRPSPRRQQRGPRTGRCAWRCLGRADRDPIPPATAQFRLARTGGNERRVGSPDGSSVPGDRGPRYSDGAELSAHCWCSA